MRTLSLLLAGSIWLAGLLQADTVRLRDGKKIEGTYLGGSARQIRFEANGNIESYNVTDVEAIEFGGEAGTAASASAAAPAPAAGKLPAGTKIVVLLTDQLDFSKSQAGDAFKAEIAEAVMSGDKEIIAKGSPAYTKLFQSSMSPAPKLYLVWVTVGGKMYNVHATPASGMPEFKPSKSIKSAGKAAAGAVADSVRVGSGAAGTAGRARTAGTSAAADGVTGIPGQKLPADTKLSFKLESELVL